MKSKIAMFLFAATLVATVSCGKKAETTTEEAPKADSTAVVKTDSTTAAADTTAAK